MGNDILKHDDSIDQADDPFKMIERPGFIVTDEWIDGKPPGLYYCWTKPGSKYYPELDIDQWVCAPLAVNAITHDSEGNNFGRMLEFKPTIGNRKTWSMPMELLKGDCSELRGMLLDMGFEITTDKKVRDRLPEYIQRQHPKETLKCVTQTGWVTPDCFVLPHKVYGAGSVTYQSGFKFTNEYRVRGTLRDWQINIAKLAIGNPMFMLALSTAFAAPLLNIINAEPGGVHFVGDSSTGKTTLLNAACSVWGGDSYKRSWRATANGLEGVAAMFNDGFLALDEISECDPSEIGEIIYSLGNGQGKQRASRTGTARAVAKWRCMILSTGERTVETSMKEGRRNIKAGQALRLIDVNVECEQGVFDNLHGFSSGSDLSNAIKKAAKEDYGVAGDVFLERLIQYRIDDDEFELPTIEAQDGQHRRVANRFVLIALAGELATTFGITGWLPGAATEAAKLAFQRWQEAQPKDRNETSKILEAVANFIDKHGDARFGGGIDSDVYCETTPITVRDRAGFKGKHGVYHFLSDGLHEALRGFDFNRAKDVLIAKGILLNATTEQRKINGENFRVYNIDSARLYP